MLRPCRALARAWERFGAKCTVAADRSEREPSNARRRRGRATWAHRGGLVACQGGLYIAAEHPRVSEESAGAALNDDQRAVAGPRVQPLPVVGARAAPIVAKKRSLRAESPAFRRSLLTRAQRVGRLIVSVPTILCWNEALYRCDASLRRHLELTG